MSAIKLGDYLRSFTESDWSAYHKFSKSLYSEKSDYQLVMDYIKKYKKRYDPNIMDAEYFRKKLRPKANKQVFSNVISNLCKHLENYMIQAEVAKDESMQDTLLLQAMAKRGITKHFFKLKSKLTLKRAKSPIGLWNNYHEFLADYLLYYCNMTSDIKVANAALGGAYTNLNLFHTTFKDYIEVEMHNRIVLLKEEWPVPAIEEIKASNETNLIQKIFKYLICLKYTRDEKYYHTLKQILLEEHISQDLSYAIMIHTTSYLNISIVQGKKNLTSELLEMYHYGIEENILFPNGNIPLMRYINIIVFACGMKEIEWAYTFVANHSKNVGRELEASAQRLGHAHIEFSKENFDEAITMLRAVKFKDFDFEIRARWLLLASNYELNKDNIDIVEYHINSFIYFVRRNKTIMTTLGSASLLKSASVLMKIARSNEPEKALEEVKKESHLLYRKWLTQKVEEKLR